MLHLKCCGWGAGAWLGSYGPDTQGLSLIVSLTTVSLTNHDGVTAQCVEQHSGAGEEVLRGGDGAVDLVGGPVAHLVPVVVAVHAALVQDIDGCRE